MGFRKKNKEYKRTICIKRSIEVNDELREWIFKNANYRRKVWNDFVEEYYRCKDKNEKFDVMRYKNEYYNDIEVPMNIYDSHCVGISEQVMKDIMTGLSVCKTNKGKLRYHRFDRFKSSFKVNANATPVFSKSYPLGKLSTRVYLIDRGIEFRERAGHKRFIRTREHISTNGFWIKNTFYHVYKDYVFSQEDIKQISFCHELGKFYICLFVNVSLNGYIKKKEIHKRKEYAGIDLGIHNPVCISDKDMDYVLRMSNKELHKINYLEKRCNKLQSILDRKTYQSKNYYRVLKKFRVSYYKMKNIRLDWRRNTCKTIALAFNNVCVDGYKIPGEDEHEGLPRRIIKKFNYGNRVYGMYYFYLCLRHTCWHYKTHYYYSPGKTTRTCSRCSHINPKLPLSQRIFKCERCNLSMDRDINASRNCYNYLVDILDTIMV